MKKNLQEIFNEIGNLTSIDQGCNDKGGQIHTYLETYDKLFAPFQSGCSLLEIGLALGHSIKLFDEYFENSTIVGCDLSIVFQPDKYKNSVRLIEADATEPWFLTKLIDYNFDIILDDGSHMEADQMQSFNMLKHKMVKGGIYIIEDILALDQNRHKFEALHDNCEIIDMRGNGRFDNVLIIFRF